MSMKTAQKNNQLATILLSAVLTVFVGFFVYQLWPVQVYEVDPHPFPVLNEKRIIDGEEIPVVKRGEDLVILFGRCKLREGLTTISSSLADGNFYTLRVSKPSNAPVGCTDKPAEVRYPIPLTTNLGRYELRATASTELPLFKIVIELFFSEEFEVIE